MARQTITFVLDSERDWDVLRYLEAQTIKSAAIREVIRGHARRSDVTLDDIYEAIQELKGRTLALPPEAQEGGRSPDEEPSDVAAALDSLGLRERGWSEGMCKPVVACACVMGR